MAMPNTAAREEELTVILDDVSLTDQGMDGGFFYKVYLDLPGMPGVGREARLLGTIGPFQIATASHGTHHGPGHPTVQLELPATDLVRRLARGRSLESLGQLSVSFVRVDAEDAPDGPVIGIGTFRIVKGQAG
jgi:tyrosinase